MQNSLALERQAVVTGMERVFSNLPQANTYEVPLQVTNLVARAHRWYDDDDGDGWDDGDDFEVDVYVRAARDTRVTVSGAPTIVEGERNHESAPLPNEIHALAADNLDEPVYMKADAAIRVIASSPEAAAAFAQWQLSHAKGGSLMRAFEGSFILGQSAPRIQAYTDFQLNRPFEQAHEQVQEREHEHEAPCTPSQEAAPPPIEEEEERLLPPRDRQSGFFG